MLFKTNVPDWKLHVQVTFPDEELHAKRRTVAQSQLDVATGGGENKKSGVQTPLIEVGEEGLSIEERAEQAEVRFQAIA